MSTAQYVSKVGGRCGNYLGGVKAAGGDKAGAENALVARDAGGGVLLPVQKCPECVLHRLSRHHLAPLPADLCMSTKNGLSSRLQLLGTLKIA